MPQSHDAEDDLMNELMTFAEMQKRFASEWILVKDCDVPVYVEHGAALTNASGGGASPDT